MDAEIPGDAAKGGTSILQEHRALMAALTDLSALIEEPGRRHAALRQRLGPFLVKLRAHFEGEERAPPFSDAATVAPHAAPRIEELAAEHPRILGQFEDAFRRLTEESAATAEADIAAHVSGDLRAAVATLRRHEAAENAIIMEAYWEDLGVGD